MAKSGTIAGGRETVEVEARGEMKEEAMVVAGEGRAVILMAERLVVGPDGNGVVETGF